MQAVKAPRAQLEQAARELYEKHFGKAAPPKVRNAQALVALGEPRALRWRGHFYRVPPVPFREGARLHVIRESLEDGENLGAEEMMLVRAAAVVSARGIMQRIAEPLGWRRYFPLNPFRKAHIGDVRDLIAFALHVPDQTPTISTGTAPSSVDLMDGVMEFARVFPGLLTHDGLPISWAHYVYGLRHIGRTVARDTLRAAQTARLAWADKETWAQFSTPMRSAAGWN